MPDVRTIAVKASQELEQTEDAFGQIRGALLEVAVQAAPNDALTRDKAILAVQVLDKVLSVLREKVDAGRIQDAADALQEALRPKDWTREPFDRSR